MDWPFNLTLSLKVLEAHQSGGLGKFQPQGKAKVQVVVEQKQLS